jgi:LAO/AO transport system kinase
VAVKGEGVAEVWEAVSAHRRHLEATGTLERRRAERAVTELRKVLVARLDHRVRATLGEARYEELRGEVAAGRVDPWSAADEILGGLSS